MTYSFELTDEERVKLAEELREGTIFQPIITPEMEAFLEQVKVTETEVPTPSGPSRIFIIEPHSVHGARPLFINFHGGGFVRGHAKRDTVFCAQAAVNLGCTVIDVDYRLAPEHPFPAAANECYGVLAWAFENAEKLDVDPTRIAVGGHSAGANLAAVACLLANEAGEFMPCGQVLDYGFFDAITDPAEKYDPRSAMPIDRMRQFNVLYAVKPENVSDRRISPVVADQKALRGLPPAFFVIAGLDPLRFEEQHYAAKLIDAEVDVSVLNFPECDHGFVITGRPGSEKARTAIFKWLEDIFKR